MADLAAQFNSCAGKVKVTPKVSDEGALIFYKYFKQANLGDVTGERPGALSFEARAKWDAWASVKGTSKEDAMKAYVAEAAKFGITP